jgi:ubiquinone/menaquinone biosynthesis C-methylase UbiE
VEIARTIVPTREGYQHWAEVYDSDGNPMIALEDRLFPSMLPEVKGLLIADLGCGTGRQTLKLVSRGARVVALDFSDAMLNRATRTANSPHASFILADVVASIPLKSGVLDGAVCSLVLEHVEDLASILREMRRVCKANGFVLVSDIHPALAACGTAANFQDPKTGEKIFPRGYRHELTDYETAAASAGFRIDAMTEAAADEGLATAMPRAAKYLGEMMLLMLRLVAC